MMARIVEVGLDMWLWLWGGNGGVFGNRVQRSRVLVTIATRLGLFGGWKVNSHNLLRL